MKAAFIERFGGPEVLQYGDLPDPVAGPGQIVVDVAAASVNGADWKVRAGQYSEAKFPLVLGRDFSGSVATLGAGVDDLKIGDAVFGVLEAGREGAYAEKIAITAAIVARKPNGLSHIDAAAVALTGLTAIAAVEASLKLQRGEKILIQGGAGGVASFAVQLAKHIGAHVITTTSTTNIDYVRGLGADEVIDYTAQDFTRAVSGLRRGVRYGRRRGGAKIIRGAPAGRPRRLHRLRPASAEARPQRRHIASARGRPRPRPARTRRRVGRDGRRAPARDQALQLIASRRSPSRQRGTSLPRQAGLSGAISR